MRSAWDGYLVIGSTTIHLSAYAGVASGDGKTQKVSTHNRNVDTGNRVKNLHVDSKTSAVCKETANCVEVGRNDNRVLTQPVANRLDGMLPDTIEVIGYLGHLPTPFSHLCRATYYLLPDDDFKDQKRYATLKRQLQTTQPLVAIAGWKGTQLPVVISVFDKMLVCYHIAWPENVRKPDNIGHPAGLEVLTEDEQVTDELDNLSSTDIHPDIISGDFQNRALALIAYEAPSINEVVETRKKSRTQSKQKDKQWSKQAT